MNKLTGIVLLALVVIVEIEIVQITSRITQLQQEDEEQESLASELIKQRELLPPHTLSHLPQPSQQQEHELYTAALSIGEKGQRNMGLSKLQRQQRTHYQRQQLQNSRTSNSSIPRFFNTLIRRKVILFWTFFFGAYDFRGSKSFSDRECPSSNCEATWNRSRLAEADAIIIHVWFLNCSKNRDKNTCYPYRSADVSSLLPPFRSPGQRWIFNMLESPYYPGRWNQAESVDFQDFGHLFNWTMTYSRSSDFTIPYGIKMAKNTTRETLEPVVNYAANKTKLVAWFVSNCETPSQREVYVKELGKYIQVDIYGRCGPFKCSKSEDCYGMLSKTYKFYLGFENSVCRDYITEKFWTILMKTTTVPIVFGGTDTNIAPDFALEAPPNSFIDALRFPSPKHLANFLLRLDANDNVYNSYHAWRKDYDIYIDDRLLPLSQRVSTTAWCNLCHALNDKNKPPKMANIAEFWSTKNNCSQHNFEWQPK